METDKNKNRVRAVFRYNRRLPDVSSILRKNWKTMVSDKIRLLKVFPEPPMVCFTRGKNLREEICQAKLPPIRLARPVEDGFKRCGRSKCRLCPYTNLNPGQVLKSVTISSTGEELPIRGSITCTTSNLLYIGTCSVRLAHQELLKGDLKLPPIRLASPVKDCFKRCCRSKCRLY